MDLDLWARALVCGTLAGVALIAEAGLCWRINLVLPARRRWLLYFVGLGTLDIAGIVWLRAAGYAAVIPPLGVIQLLGGIGTMIAFQILGGYDDRDTAITEGSGDLHEQPR